MVSKNIILGNLKPFLNKENVVVENQGVNDIITGILKTHDKYKSEYDKIYSYFIGYDLQETSKNIWNFLKKNVPYYIESNDLQYLKSPSSIICTPSDCKSFALFSGGVLDALRRNENPDIEILYRFASYDPFDKIPGHVFVVVRGDGEEFWIDPVLDKFNEKKQPYFYKDKNINKMALVGLSGVRSKMGDIVMDENGNYYDSNTGEYIDQSGNLPGDAVQPPLSSNFDWTNLFGSVLKAAPAIITATKGGTPQNVSNPNLPGYKAPATSTSAFDINNLLLLGAVGFGAYYLFFKKK
jgi:hypothetical protein